MSCEISTQGLGLKLRAEINEILKNFIGRYHFPSGGSVPAIAVIPDLREQYPATGTVIEGLEVVINYPQPSMTVLLDTIEMGTDWIILLKQWDVAETTIEPTNYLLPRLNPQYLIHSVYRNSGNLQTNQPEICRIILRILLGL